MHKSQTKTKLGVTLSCFNIPDVFIEDKIKAKQYFQKYGKVVRIIIRPKRKNCIVEFDNPESAMICLIENGNYEGYKFRITWAKNKSNEDSLTTLKKGKKPAWSGDSEIMKELEAMKGSHSFINSFSSRTENPEIQSFEPVHKKESGHVVHKKTIPKTLPKIAKPRKIEKPKIVEPAFNINSEQATELMKIIMKAADNAEAKYRILDARDKLIRLKMVRQSSLRNVGRTIGTCPDMCPEKERLMRVAQHQVALYEQMGGSKNSGMNHAIAVKQYSRSSADQESPLAHDLRPVHILQITMGYLLHRIMDLCDTPDVNLGEWYHFLWDRTRGIRKDITQQELCCQGSVCLIEQCARFHIHCSVRLVAEDASVFDQKINTENLTKCLQTLKYMYHDLAVKGVVCQREAEFRGYIVLLNLNDGNFMWEVQQLSREIQESEEVKFALQVYFALDKNNYVRFFKLVRSTTYLNACILLRYFNQVRIHALRRILKSYSPRQPYTLFPIAELSNVLAFEDHNSAIEFLEHYGLSINKEKSHVLLDRKMFCQPDLPFQLERAINVIESKRNCSVGEIVCGATLPPKLYEKIIPHNSFDDNGHLKVNEIPSDWQVDYSEGVLSNESIEQEIEVEDMDLTQEVNIPEVKTTFSFCLPSNIDIVFPKEVPMSDTNFLFQAPKNLEYVEEVKTLPIVKNIFEGVIKNDSFKETEKLNVFKTDNTVNMFEIPIVVDKVDIDCVDNTMKKLEQKVVEKKKEIISVKPQFVFQPILKPVSPSIPTESPKEVFKNPNIATTKKRNIEKLIHEKTRIKISVTNPADHLKDMKKQEIIKKDVKQTIDNLIDDIESKIEFELKLEQLADRIKTRKIQNYINKWRNVVKISKRKRKNFFDNPTWISKRSVKEEAIELRIPSLNYALDNMKMYKQGSTNVSLVTRKKKKMDVLNVTNIALKILSDRMNKANELPCLDIYWKVLVSILDTTHNSKYHNELFDDLFNWKTIDGTTKLIERKNMINGGLFTYCLEKYVRPNTDIDGLIYFVQFNSLTTFYIQLLAQNNYQSPFIVIIYDCPMESKDLIVQVLQIKCVSANFEVVLVKGNVTRSIVIAALQWLAHNVTKNPDLQMESLGTLLTICVGDEFWHRVNASAKMNERIDYLLCDPNFTINLYNLALENLEKLISNDFKNYQSFPVEFKSYFNIFILPCTYEHFPENWKTLSQNSDVKNIVNCMKLPNFVGNWPPKSLQDLEIEIEKYLNLVFDDSNIVRLILKYISYLCNFDDFLTISTSISWSKILETIVKEKINNVDKEVMAIYILNDLKQLRNIPWWYNCTEIATQLNSIEDQQNYSEIDEDSDEEMYELDMNETIEQGTKNILAIENIDEGLKNDVKNLSSIIDDLEQSLKIQKQIMMKFNETASLILNDTEKKSS